MKILDKIGELLSAFEEEIVKRMNKLKKNSYFEKMKINLKCRKDFN